MKTTDRYIPAFLFTIAILLSFLISGCEKSEQHSREPAVSGLSLDSAEKAPAEFNRDGRMQAGDETAAEAGPSLQRKVITTYFLTLEVRDLNAAFDTVVSLVNKHGGYTTETNRSKNPDGSYTGRIVIRLRQAAAGGLLEMLKSTGTVIVENSMGEDITEEYVDLEARLKNMKASETRLRDLLSRRTPKLADVLAVEKELTRVRGQIEAFEARKRTWDTLTSLATIHVELLEPRGAFPVFYKIWNPIRTAFGDALEGFARSLHSAIVFFGIVLPWALPVGALVYGGIHFFRKIRRARKSAQ